MTWEVRAVDQDGGNATVLAVSASNSAPGVNLQSIEESVGGDERLTLQVPALHGNAAELELFDREVQVWYDGSIYRWFRPGRYMGDPANRTVECPGLFDHFYDEVIGGERPNHVTSPHLDSAAVGAAPADWTVTGEVEDAAIVDNNATFWQVAKALQLNNSEAGQDAYAYVRVPVPAELVGVPFAVAAEVYVADDSGGAPAYGGAAYQNRGVLLQRLDGTSFAELTTPKVAEITDDTPRNQVVRLQTPEVTPQSTSEVLEVRLYAPAAFTAWRYVFLGDGRALAVDRSDKSVAVEALVAHFQDTTIGKQDRGFLTDVVNLGETVSRSWPWWRRDNIGEQLDDLADTFELEVVVTATTRTLRARAVAGSDLTGTVTLTNEDLTGWSVTADRRHRARRVILQGEGSGPARDEAWVDDPSALNGHLREFFDAAPPGTPLQGLWDQAEALHGQMREVVVLPSVTVAGALALSLRAGDRVSVDFDYGSIVYLGAARIMHKKLNPQALTAELELVPFS